MCVVSDPGFKARGAGVVGGGGRVGGAGHPAALVASPGHLVYEIIIKLAAQ